MGLVQIVPNWSVTEISTDVIITSLSPYPKSWNSDSDQAIRSVASNYFHMDVKHLADAGNWHTAAMRYKPWDRNYQKSKFSSILFFCDDPYHPRPLKNLLMAAFTHAYAHNCTRFVLPHFRGDTISIENGANPTTTINDVAGAVSHFRKFAPDAEITFVINDLALFQKYLNAFSSK